MPGTGVGWSRVEIIRSARTDCQNRNPTGASTNPACVLASSLVDRKDRPPRASHTDHEAGSAAHAPVSWIRYPICSAMGLHHGRTACKQIYGNPKRKRFLCQRSPHSPRRGKLSPASRPGWTRLRAIADPPPGMPLHGDFSELQFQRCLYF